MAEFETVTVETDLLILGGGMAACGAAVEACYWAKKHNLKVALVDKAPMDRSGAVAMGLSAINQYVDLNSGNNTLRDYVDYVRNDLMGITREDLVVNIARHVDSTVHLFEKWGLPIWKDKDGKYVHEGRWQLMINGESYKVIVAEAAKNAMAEAGGQVLRARVRDPSAGAGRQVRGRHRLQPPRKQGVRVQGQGHPGGHGRRGARVQAAFDRGGLRPLLVPPLQLRRQRLLHHLRRCRNDLPGSALHPRAFQRRLRPGGCVVPAVQVGGHQRQGGQLHAGDNAAELDKWEPYGKVKPAPANIRNWLMMLDVMDGKGPIYMQTAEAIKQIAAKATDEKEAKKKLKELEAEAWEDFLDMTISAGDPLGRHQHRAGTQAVGDHGLRSLLHRLALGRLRVLGFRVPPTCRATLPATSTSGATPA